MLVTGGDAFFAKESYNYMKFMSENFPKITLMTESNGIAFNEKFQQIACKNLFKTHFSLNASNAESFAKSCWDSDDGDTAKKLFPFIIRNIKSYLKKLDAENKLCFAPDLSMVINKDNADDILNFTELALNFHAGFIVFFFDYTENDMSSDYFTNPAITRPALKTLMELERVLAEGCFVIGEFNQRNEIRKQCGKNILSLVDDISPTLNLKKVEDREICFAPWNEIDLYPDGRMDFCSWFQPTLNIKNFIQVKNGKEFVDWDEILNSYEYVAARYRILHNDYEGCQVCCPMNSVKNPVEACTKYNLDRLD